MRILDSRPLSVRLSGIERMVSIGYLGTARDNYLRRLSRLSAADNRRRAAIAAWDRAVAHFRRPAFESYNREIEADSLTALSEIGVKRPATTESVAYGF